MGKLPKKDAVSNYNRHFNKWEELDNKYMEINRRYYWSGSIAGGQPTPRPEAITIEIAKELDRIAKELDVAKHKLDKASKQLYEAYH